MKSQKNPPADNVTGSPWETFQKVGDKSYDDQIHINGYIGVQYSGDMPGHPLLKYGIDA